MKSLIHLGMMLLTLCACGTTNAADAGFVEGHVTIGPLKPVELQDATPQPISPEVYAQYPLVILRADGQTEVLRVNADTRGNYRVALAPGDYILDVVGRAPKRVRANPQPFTIVSNQMVRVDMNIDTGIR